MPRKHLWQKTAFSDGDHDQICLNCGRKASTQNDGRAVFESECIPKDPRFDIINTRHSPKQMKTDGPFAEQLDYFRQKGWEEHQRKQGKE